MVKDEKNYDKFDKAFNSFYKENKNIINQVEKKIYMMSFIFYTHWYENNI